MNFYLYGSNVYMSLKCVCRCAAAYVLLAEEEATTITEAERLFRKALSIGECVLNCPLCPPVFRQDSPTCVRPGEGQHGAHGRTSATGGVVAIFLCFSVEYLDIFLRLLDGHVPHAPPAISRRWCT